MFAASQWGTLRKVLRQSNDGEQRAIAATIIAYTQDKREVISDLKYAMQDPFENVRNNAIRALWGVAALANRKPELGIQISPNPFILLLDPIAWSDRNKAMLVLLQLTEKHPANILGQIRDRALPQLIEMARWKRSHALEAYMLLERIESFRKRDREQLGH